MAVPRGAPEGNVGAPSFMHSKALLFSPRLLSLTSLLALLLVSGAPLKITSLSFFPESRVALPSPFSRDSPGTTTASAFTTSTTQLTGR